MLSTFLCDRAQQRGELTGDSLPDRHRVVQVRALDCLRDGDRHVVDEEGCELGGDLLRGDRGTAFRDAARARTVARISRACARV
jgi:hypothetical protein